MLGEGGKGCTSCIFGHLHILVSQLASTISYSTQSLNTDKPLELKGIQILTVQPAQINYVILKKWNAPGFNLNRLIGSNKLMHTGVCECVCVGEGGGLLNGIALIKREVQGVLPRLIGMCR